MRYGSYPDLVQVKNILVIKLRHLGDVLLTSPVLTVLRRVFPSAEIDVYLYAEARPMLEGHPAINGWIEYDLQWKQGTGWQRFWKEVALWRQIRKKHYDLVINLTEGDRGGIAARIAGAPIRVGFEPKGHWQKKFYTHLVKPCSGVRHTVEKNLDVLRKIGIFPNWEERELFLHIPPSACHAMQARVGSEPFILIHPTSRWRFKCWPIAKMRECIIRLLAQGKKIVLTSGPDQGEQEMASAIAQGLDVQVLAGQITLKELAALILLSDLLVCVDSVPLHMASALKKGVVALFGPTSEVNWGPWRNPHARIVAEPLPCRPCYQDGCGGSKHSDCLHTLSVEKVLAAIETLEPAHFVHCK